MEEKKRSYKPITFILLLIGISLVIGATVAYYTTSDSFTNEFDAGKYIVEAKEKFVSPDNWTPGTTTPKEITVTNKGDVDAAVKVCFTQSWVGSNNESVSLKDANNNYAAILNFASNSNKHWLPDCTNNGETKYCFYYYKKLEPNESTTALLDSVTFNSNVNIDSTKDCETVNGVTTCTTTASGYAGAKYTLNVNIETVQYDQYQNVFTNVQVRNSNNQCENLNIKEEGLPRYKIAYMITDYNFIKDSELDDYDLTKATCEIGYVGEEIEENKYNICFDSIRFDDKTYEAGELVEVPYQYVRFSYSTAGVYTGFEDDMFVYGWAYSKSSNENYGYPFVDGEISGMNFTNIRYINSEMVLVSPQTSFIMPNHDVLLYGDLGRD